jgi:Leucine-rich repeat (LRR) protein
MRVTDLGLARLSKLEKLQHLDVSGSAITPNGLKALSSLRDLRRLSLWNVKGIDDTAAPYLEALGNLTSLDLSNTAIGDETLARLAKLSSLRRLYVSETKVTDQGLAAFRKRHPTSVVSSDARPAPRVPLNPGRQHDR